MKKSKNIIIVISLITIAIISLAIIFNLNDNKTNAVQTDNINTEKEYDVYRGIIKDVGDNFILVQQVQGFDYGEYEIKFDINDSTIFETNDINLENGHYVEIQYNSVTGSVNPSQSTADKIILINSFGKEIIQNGEIISTNRIDSKNISIEINPFDENGELLRNKEDRVILLVPIDSLESIELDALEEGIQISAITKGISTNSMPPQYPVTTLLPFTTK